MSKFRKYVEKSLLKIPEKHKKLLKDFEIKSTEKPQIDKKHIGEMDPEKKKIKISNPDKFTKENVLLHEIAHLVWEALSQSKKKAWKKLVPKSSEENFCNCYASYYSDSKIKTYQKPAWIQFVQSL